MEGTIMNYRRGLGTQRTNQYIVQVEGVEEKSKADSLSGRKVVWKTTSGKEIVGKISKAHGNSGAVLARFNQGLPGQAVGTKVAISD